MVRRWRYGLIVVFALGGCSTITYQERSGAGAPLPTEPPVAAPAAPPPAPAGPLSYQDREEQALRTRFAGTGVQVLRSGDVIRLVVPNSQVFALSSERILPEAEPLLNDIAGVLNEYDKTGVTIKGFTDSAGSFVYNQQLSERRARSLGSYFIGRRVAASRVNAVGYGPRYPAANNNTESGRIQNRRVEIELVPLH